MYKIINVLGLSIGISCALVIFAYIHFELSFDKHHKNYNQIFRITEAITSDEGSVVHRAKTPGRLGNAISEHGIPELSLLGRLFPTSAFISANKQAWQKEDLFVYADSTISEMFSFELVHGSLENSLKKPMTVALTESAVTKFFGDTNPLGKEIHYEDESGKHSFSVGAIIKDPPRNSHFDYRILASFSSMETVMPWYNNWYHPYLFTYGFMNKVGPEGFSLVENKLQKKIYESLPEWEKDARSYTIQPLPDIHLHSNLTSEWKSNSRYEYVVIFILIAVFILLIACVNFINLSTSRAMRRAKEVGVRKVMGASRKMLIIQFLGESFLTTFISFVVAFALTEWVMLLVFNKIVDRPLSLSILLQPEHLFYITVGLILIGVLSGLYPAYALSSFKPSTVLRSRSAGGVESARLRKVLVTFQFTISCFLIAGTLIVAKQINFMKNTNLGFTKDYIVLVKLDNQHDQQNYQQFIDQVSQFPGIKGAAVSSHVPGAEVLYDNPVVAENSAREGVYNMLVLNVGPDFGKIYDLQVLYGRDFSKENHADVEKSVLINESAARLFGWDPGNSIGNKLQLTWYTDSALVKETQVVGVVKDFHFKSLHKKIDPLVMHINTHEYYTEFISVRFNETNFDDALAFLTKEWKIFSPERPIEARFLDDELKKLYMSETQAGTILTSFAVLAIFISCLGLFGLSAYAAEKRTKEIGIRKTMGASVNKIVELLARDFMVLIFIGNLIALPLVAILSNKWLTNFAYKTNVGFWIYGITLVAAIFIGFFTISFQSIKAAIANPVDSLKEE